MKMIHFLLPVCLLGSFANAQSYSESAKSKIESFFTEANQNLGVTDRLLAASEHFLGTDSGWTAPSAPKDTQRAEVLSVDLEKLNCVTYVEHAFALSRSNSWETYLEELKLARYYFGNVTFNCRHHFTEADWLPQQIERQAVRDITPEISKFDPASLQVARAKILRKAWVNALYPLEAASYDDSGVQSEIDASVNYIDYDYMWTQPVRTEDEVVVFESKEKELFQSMIIATGEDQKKLRNELEALRKDFRLRGAELRKDFIESLPNISIAINIRPTHSVTIKDPANPESKTKVTDMLVTHLGFVIKQDGNLIFRHAPSKDGSKVVDVPFEAYFSTYMSTGSNMDHPANRRSTWRGLSFVTVLPQSENK